MRFIFLFSLILLTQARGEVSFGGALLIARDYPLVSSYFSPRPDEHLQEGFVVDGDVFFQLIRVDKKLILYQLQLPPKHTETIVIGNRLFLRLEENGVWKIDEKAPAEAPLGGIATRANLHEVAMKILNNRTRITSTKWSEIIQLLFQVAKQEKE
jgi:hypothetical protein